MSNRLIVTSQLGLNQGVEPPKVYSPDTLSGMIPKNYQPERRLSYVDSESGSPQNRELA
jgi:hypothetical protein